MLTSIHNDHNFQVFKLDKILARPETTGIALLPEIRTCVREGWSGVREDLLCLGLTFIETFDHSVKPRLTVAFPLGVLLGVVVYQALILFYQP